VRGTDAVSEPFEAFSLTGVAAGRAMSGVNHLAYELTALAPIRGR
jgi:hypothetical protein